MSLTKLYSLPDPPSLPRHDFKELLLFATKKSHFVFDGDYYDQIDDLAVGSPLGQVLYIEIHRVLHPSPKPLREDPEKLKRYFISTATRTLGTNLNLIVLMTY